MLPWSKREDKTSWNQARKEKSCRKMWYCARVPVYCVCYRVMRRLIQTNADYETKRLAKFTLKDNSHVPTACVCFAQEGWRPLTGGVGAQFTSGGTNKLEPQQAIVRAYAGWIHIHWGGIISSSHTLPPIVGRAHWAGVRRISTDYKEPADPVRFPHIIPVSQQNDILNLSPQQIKIQPVLVWTSDSAWPYCATQYCLFCFKDALKVVLDNDHLTFRNTE